MIYDTLFKRSSGGKVIEWFAEVDGDRYRTTSGQQDGKKTTTEWTVAKAKNVGRANETTPEQQAIAEVEAEYDKKLARDYHRQLDTVDEAMRFKPMLATKWADVGPKITDTHVFMQPKLDGMRCIATATGLWTREGKRIHGAPHIQEVLAPIFEAWPSAVIDGELYNHDLRDNFNKIISCAKKQKPTAEDLEVSRQNLQYWVYDVPSIKGGFQGRLDHLYDTLNDIEYVVITDTVLVHIDLVDKHASEWIELGYEGAMVRIRHGHYENKRSKFLIKWKEMQDEEFEIVDIQEGDGNRAGMAARVVLRLEVDQTFSAGLIGNVDYCKQLLAEKDKHIGKMGTVVFQNYTPDGVPRFPKFKCVRDYE